MATSVDLGRVVGDTGPAGATGATGATGPAGRDGYIPQFELEENGDLYVVYPDNVLQDIKFTLDDSGNVYYEIVEE